MLRFIILSTAVTLLAQSTIAQQPPVTLKPTPEVLALLTESQSALPNDDANLKTVGLLRTLNLEMRFEDKTPAQATINLLLPLAAALPEPQSAQLYEALAVAYTDLGQYDAAAKLLDNVKQDDARSRIALNLAFRIANNSAEKDKAKSFDTTELVNKAITGAVAVKDAYTEATARAVLAQVLFRNEKPDEARTVVAEALKTAKKLEEIEENNITAFVVRVLCEAGNDGAFAEALDVVKTTVDADAKNQLTGIVVNQLWKNEKTAEAEKLLQEIPAGDAKDRAVVSIADLQIAKLTDVQIVALAAFMSTPERKTQFLQSAVAALLNNDRDDVAVKLLTAIPENQEAKHAVQLKPLRALLKDKKFDEAAQLLDTVDDERLKLTVKRQLALLKYRETGDETVLQPIPATYSEDEKKAIDEIDARLTETLASPASGEQVQTLLQMVQAEYQLGKITAVKQILAHLLAYLDKETDPVKQVALRIAVVRMQLELGDKAGAVANLTKLLTVVSEVKNVMDFAGLVPPKEQDNPIANGTAVKLKIPATQQEVEAQVFQIYLVTSSFLKQANAEKESKETFQKAKAFADSLTNAAAKSEMLFVLAQHLLQENAIAAQK